MTSGGDDVREKPWPTPGLRNPTCKYRFARDASVDHAEVNLAAVTEDSKIATLANCGQLRADRDNHDVDYILVATPKFSLRHGVHVHLDANLLHHSTWV